MVEEIFNYVKPIAVIPPQQIMEGRINELRRKAERTRKKEAKDLLQKEIGLLEKQLADLYRSLGR